MLGIFVLHHFKHKTTPPTTEKAASKQDLIPYNYVYCSEAQTLAKNVNSGNYNSSLMFGVQWDSDSIFTLSRGKYGTWSYGNISEWKSYEEDTSGFVVGKEKKQGSIHSACTVLTTGVTTRNMKQNDSVLYSV